MSSAQTQKQGQSHKISVRVKKEGSKYTIKSTHDLPPPMLVKRHLTTKDGAHRSIANYHWESCSIESLIAANTGTGKIRASDWSQAIAKATADMLDNFTIAITDLDAIGSGGYAVFGQTIFRLDVKEVLPVAGRALPMLRRRVEQDAKIEAQSILDLAHKDVQKLRLDANADVTKALMEAATIRAEFAAEKAKLAQLPPDWMHENNIHFHYKTHYPNNWVFCIDIPFTFRIISFEWSSGDPHTLDALPAAPVTLFFSIPLGNPKTGKFHIRSVFCNHTLNRGFLPHMSDSSCADTSETLPPITSMSNVQLAASIISRVHSIVNFDSLLTAPPSWTPHIRPFIPPSLQKVLDSATSACDISLSFLNRLGRKKGSTAAEALTFSAPRPAVPQVEDEEEPYIEPSPEEDI